MTDEQLLNSLQGTMATIDPYSVKKEAIDEYRIDTVMAGQPEPVYNLGVAMEAK